MFKRFIAYLVHILVHIFVWITRIIRKIKTKPLNQVFGATPASTNPLFRPSLCGGGVLYTLNLIIYLLSIPVFNKK